MTNTTADLLENISSFNNTNNVNISSYIAENNSSSNCTTCIDFNDNVSEALKSATDNLMIIMVLIVMMAMGTDISWNQIWKHLRRPWGVIIGVFCHYVVMPLLAFMYKHIFQLDSEISTGLIIVSCSPGGILSNIFNYYLDGEVSLSVTITAISTTLGLGLMPLNVWIYSREITAGQIIISFVNMIISLVTITSPIFVGMLIRWKFPNISAHITKWGSALGFLLFLIVFILEMIPFRKVIHEITLKLILTTILMPATGIIIGYLLGFISRRSRSVCTTIAIETGIQNVPAAITVITLSFPVQEQIKLLLAPCFYLVFQAVIGILMCVIYKISIKCCKKPGISRQNINKDVKHAEKEEI
ncbi:solute carrier family 10 member 6-like [Centruroides sculpturatus]|uniref:solute carrier family 10 member 6-like n=1 Tax=Centruroides sculpturatus TaxID=218467 RepID=UPI000C6DD383|nr:solute carrier family 10 member 6-like [Centruroides sculpturatus]